MKDKETESVRLGHGLMEEVRLIAEKESRTIRGQLEILIRKGME